MINMFLIGCDHVTSQHPKQLIVVANISVIPKLIHVKQIQAKSSMSFLSELTKNIKIIWTLEFGERTLSQNITVIDLRI